MDEIKYDGAGRQVASRTLIGETGGSYEYRYNRYDATGRLWDSRVVVRSAKPSDNQKVASRTDVLYHDVDGVTGLGYDAAGNLMGVRQDADGQITTTTYKYSYLNGSWQQSAAVTNRGSTQVATVTQRDANGFVVGIRQPKTQAQGRGTDWIMEELNRAKVDDVRYDRTFVNDASGTAVFVSQGGYNDLGEVKSSIANPASGYQGGVTGSALTPGHVQRQLVANGEVLARYGDAPTREENTPQTNNPAYVDTADFRLQAAQIRPRHESMDPIAYTVVGGETLKDIARNVLGDASLWWRIAEANSLAVSGDGQLTAGQTLTVPKLSLNANSVETFQPYDPSQAMGSMDPVLPVPEGHKGGCGGLGKLIVMVVTIVVAAVTQQYYLLNYGASMIAAGAAGGAAGSIAGQVVGNVLGVQDGFSWKSVALSAMAAGVSGGLADSAMLGGTGLTETVVRAAVGNTLTQGIGVVTGLQDRFDWKGVVASAVGAGVGWGMNEALGLTDVNGRPTGTYDGVEKFARAGLSGFGAGTAAAVMRGGRISVQQVATDAFGNALGQGLASTSTTTPTQGQGPWSAVDYRNGSDIESDSTVLQRQAQPYYDQLVEALSSAVPTDASDDVLLSALKGFTLERGTPESLPYTGQGLKLPSGYAPEALGAVGYGPADSAFSSASNWLAAARTSDQSFYTDSINSAGSGVAASLYTIGRALNGAAYDLGQGAVTLYGLATDSDVRGRVFTGISSAVGSVLDNPLGSLTRGGYAISNYFKNTSIGQMGEDALRFGSGTLAGAGIGKLTGAAGLLGLDSIGAGLRYSINALPESSFNSFIQASTALDKALYRLNPANYEWSGMAAGTLGAIPTPTGLKLSGVVEVRVPMWATAVQKADYALYTRVANEALDAGYLSPVGRVATSSTGLRIEADRAIAAERALAIQQGRPYQGVVGHGPDTTWTGKPEAFRWLDQDFRVNSSLGGQSGRYPLGFKPTGFVLRGLK